MADVSPETRSEAIAWFVGTLLVVALITYAAWDSARDNAEAQQAHSTQQAPTAH